MKDHFKFATGYWHTFCGAGHDPFGTGTKIFPWAATSDAVARAHEKMDTAFEFITKIGTPYYCFHDIDLIDEGSSRAETSKRLQTIVEYAKSVFQ